MKPTQQEIIDLAHEDGGHTYPEWLRFVPIFALERLVHLALERFGAGGGEPSRDMPHGWVTNWPAPNGGTRPVYHASAIKPKYGPDNSLVSYPVFTRPGPSPTDLRAEYLRGLGEGFKEGWIECSKWAQRDDLIADIGSPSYEACVSAVKALKGKQ